MVHPVPVEEGVQSLRRLKATEVVDGGGKPGVGAPVQGSNSSIISSIIIISISNSNTQPRSNISNSQPGSNILNVL